MIAGDHNGIGFPSKLLMLEGLQYLTAGACTPHHDVVRTMFRAEGSSAEECGESIAAAGLCEHRAAGLCNLSHLCRAHLSWKDDSTAAEMAATVLSAIDATQWRWTDGDDPLVGLGPSFTGVTILPPKEAARGRLYKLKPDDCGVDLVGLSAPIRNVSVLVGVRVKLTAGSSTSTVGPSDLVPSQ